MQSRTLSLLAVLAAALPLAGQADTMDYSFAELAYLDTELDNDFADVDGDGFSLRGSVAVNETFFVFAGYEDLGFDFDLDLTTLQVGVGAHWPLKDKLDIVGHAGIVQAEIDAGPFDVDDEGFLIGARLRAEVAPKFELEGGFDYTDLDDFGNDTAIVGEARYFFIPQLSGGVLVRVSDDATTIGLAGRWTF